MPTEQLAEISKSVNKKSIQRIWHMSQQEREAQQVWLQCRENVGKYVDRKIPEKPESYYKGLSDLIDHLIHQHKQVTQQLHNHREAEKSILLQSEYENFKKLVETLETEEQEATKVHHILKSWHVHYGEVYEQLSKARETLTKLCSQQKTTTNILLQQQIEKQISMQSKRIDQLQEEKNQWFQHS